MQRAFIGACVGACLILSGTAIAEPASKAMPDRMIVLGDDATNGFQAFPFTSINSLWCKVDGSIVVSHIRISDNQLFNTTVDANPVDQEAACQSWLDYFNGSGSLPPINP